MQFYRYESKLEDGLVVIQHFLWGRLALEELWHRPKDVWCLWGVTLFDWLTIGAGVLMTANDEVRLAESVVSPLYSALAKAALFGRNKDVQVSAT